MADGERCWFPINIRVMAVFHFALYGVGMARQVSADGRLPPGEEMLISRCHYRIRCYSVGAGAPH